MLQKPPAVIARSRSRWFGTRRLRHHQEFPASAAMRAVKMKPSRRPPPREASVRLVARRHLSTPEQQALTRAARATSCHSLDPALRGDSRARRPSLNDPKPRPARDSGDVRFPVHYPRRQNHPTTHPPPRAFRAAPPHPNPPPPGTPHAAGVNRKFWSPGSPKPPPVAFADERPSNTSSTCRRRCGRLQGAIFSPPAPCHSSRPP